jgi:hypothetical protein
VESNQVSKRVVYGPHCERHSCHGGSKTAEARAIRPSPLRDSPSGHHETLLENIAMSAPGSTFFSTLAGADAGDWTELRNRWELSHAIIAGFVTLSLISLALVTSLLADSS